MKTKTPTLTYESTLPDPSWSRFGERAKFMPVSFILSVIALLWCIYMSQHCGPLLQSADTYTQGVVDCTVFNFLTGMLLFCYFRSVLQHPGTVPEKERTRAFEASPYAGAKETKTSGEKRNCKWCDKFKPDRAHHCRVCRMCILKMDHHCPWIYNCVGFHNHKYFFLLVLYVVLDLHFLIWTMLSTVMKKATDEEMPFMDLYCLLLGESVAALFGFIFTTFLFFHTYLILQNMTTIEFCEKSTKLNSFRLNARPFDRGFVGNMKAALGDNFFLWFVPCSPPSGDGLSFNEEETPLNAKDTCWKSEHGKESMDGMDVAQNALNSRSRAGKGLQSSSTISGVNGRSGDESDVCETKPDEIIKAP